MYIVVLITCANKKEAENISTVLVRDKLVACVNIVDKIQSLFWWQGKVDRANEILLLAKTRKQQFSRLEKKVKSLHSYEVPEIIALPIVTGNKAYLKWIDKSLAR